MTKTIVEQKQTKIGMKGEIKVMVKKYVCKDGTVYAGADYYLPVEELIEFLEQFRGKLFYNGAAESLGFRIDGEHVWCDTLDYILGEIEDDDLCFEVCDYFYE